jgi:hypothetical protein
MSSLVVHVCPDPTFTFASSLRRDRPSTNLSSCRFALLSRAPSAARAAGHDARLTFLAPRSKILLTRSNKGLVPTTGTARRHAPRRLHPSLPPGKRPHPPRRHRNYTPAVAVTEGIHPLNEGSMPRPPATTRTQNEAARQCPPAVHERSSVSHATRLRSVHPGAWGLFSQSPRHRYPNSPPCHAHAVQ